MGGELLTPTECIVWRRQEYFDFLNATITPSEGEPDLEDSGLGSLINGVEVAEDGKQLCSCNTQGVG